MICRPESNEMITMNIRRFYKIISLPQKIDEILFENNKMKGQHASRIMLKAKEHLKKSYKRHTCIFYITARKTKISPRAKMEEIK